MFYHPELWPSQPGDVITKRRDGVEDQKTTCSWFLEYILVSIWSLVGEKAALPVTQITSFFYHEALMHVRRGQSILLHELLLPSLPPVTTVCMLLEPKQ